MRTSNRCSHVLIGAVLSFLTSVATPTFAQEPESVAPILICGGAGICRDTNPNDCFVARCIEGNCELDVPSPGATRCTLPGNPCSLGRCVPHTGDCAPSEPMANGTPCPDTDGSVCTVASCQAGSCNQGGAFPEVPSMLDPAKVEVKAREIRVTENEAFTDCCVFCGEQRLEALTPTPTGPIRQALDGGLPLRTTYCGTVVRYGTKDEQADPRDIMLNMVPSQGFEHFVKGFLNTECTGLSSAEKSLFAKKDAQCPTGACLAASENPNRTGRCVHVEITPAQQFYGKDSRFLPISSDGECGDSWNCKSALEPASQWSGAPPSGGQAGQAGREACVSGVYAVDHGGDHGLSGHRNLCCSPDAGHDRPEIHPMDAIWFRQPGGALGWVFGVFQDDSNRYSFPHCSDDHNGNRWSEAPRDMTFRFPVRLPRSPIPWKACLRHTRNGRTPSQEILPVNVTTSSMPAPLAEVKSLRDPTGAIMLEVVEPLGAENETQVRLEGCVTNDQITGFLTVRVAVGCPRGSSCPSLSDRGDPGSGFYYGDLVFQASCN